MAWHRFLFRAGAVVWIAGGLGHLALIDVLTLHGRTGVATLVPHADVLATMDATTLSFGARGTLVFQLTTFGRQQGLALRPFIVLSVIVSAAFGAVAAVCFIIPPTLGAVLATALFVASWVRNES